LPRRQNGDKRADESNNAMEIHRTLSLNIDLHIDRSRVSLEELLGDGQFGNVYRGTYTQEVRTVWVNIRHPPSVYSA
uniref:Protein kinase domain-containing protein n=1 Tax=Anisakis simplex TaxID=6269 RepID=A0A0M3JN33_ANISI